MRIGYDAKRLFNNFTGLGNYSRFIVGGIHAFFPNEKLFLFTPKARNHPETKSFQQENGYTTVLPSTLLTKFKLGSYWRSFRLNKEAEKQHLDIFHGLSHELPRGISAVTKSVVTVHDLIFLRFPQFYKPIDRWIYSQKIKYACREANAIVAISEQTKHDLIEFLNVPEEKIHVVYQGCHPNFKRPIPESELADVRRKYTLPEEFLLNVGTIEPRKNALLILQAMKALGDTLTLPLVIIGRATAYADTLKIYAQEHSLEHRIHFIHQVSFADLPAIYKMSRAFIYPSLFEGFGIPLVEAIACGTPVITSTGSCFSEAAGPNALYVPPDDAAELAKAIERVVKNNSLRDTMIKESTQYIRRFEPEVIANDMMKLYRSLLK